MDLSAILNWHNSTKILINRSLKPKLKMRMTQPVNRRRRLLSSSTLRRWPSWLQDRPASSTRSQSWDRREIWRSKVLPSNKFSKKDRSYSWSHPDHSVCHQLAREAGRAGRAEQGPWGEGQPTGRNHGEGRGEGDWGGGGGGGWREPKPGKRSTQGRSCWLDIPKGLRMIYTLYLALYPNNKKWALDCSNILSWALSVATSFPTGTFYNASMTSRLFKVGFWVTSNFIRSTSKIKSTIPKIQNRVHLFAWGNIFWKRGGKLWCKCRYKTKSNLKENQCNLRSFCADSGRWVETENKKQWNIWIAVALVHSIHAY